MMWRTFDFAAVGFGTVHFVGGVGTVRIGVAAEAVGYTVAGMTSELSAGARAVGLVAEIAAVVLPVTRGVIHDAPKS